MSPRPKIIIAVAVVALLAVLVAIPRNKPPQATFTPKPDEDRPQEVSFDASDSKDPDGQISEYDWDFGDEKTGRGAKVQHRFEKAGIFRTKLTVTDNGGKKDVFSKQISILPVAPANLKPHSNNGDIELTWRPVPGATSYKVTWSTGEKASSEPGKTVTVESPPFVHRGLTYLDEYTYVVTALADSGEGPPSTSVSTQVVPPPSPSSYLQGVSFLYSGENPRQSGVADGAIDERRVVVLRGRVLNRKGDPISDVKVCILNDGQFGETKTRSDGMFDFATNGGGRLTVCYEKDGFLPVQRPIGTNWQSYKWLPDVTMIKADVAVTKVNLSANAGAMQVARSTEVQDNDGKRTATLLIPSGATAEAVLPDGTTKPLNQLSIRMTEYTRDDEGPSAMPAPLPPGTNYTYCVEFTADEAESVRFSEDKPLIHYVENFPGFPVGVPVPTGYYDREKAQWIASKNGRVIQVLSIKDAEAILDVDGNGEPASEEKLAELGIDLAERKKLAELYAAETTLWRVPIPHFSPWDCNCRSGLGPGCPAPDPPPPGDPPKSDCAKTSGSLIKIHSQTLGESFPVTGTPYDLVYMSDRVPGRLADRTLRIPLIGEAIPPLKRIELEIYIAGQRHNKTFSPQPNQEFTFTWDGFDAYGRLVEGSRKVEVRIGYVYQGVYMEPAEVAESFGRFSEVPMTGNREKNEITLWRDWAGTLENRDVQNRGLGGLTFDLVHHFDPNVRVLYRGDGDQRAAADVSQVVRRLAGGGKSQTDGASALSYDFEDVSGVAVAPDGSIFACLYERQHRVVKISADGTVTTVAGNGTEGDNGDAGPATEAQLYAPVSVAFGADGTLYIGEQRYYGGRVRTVAPNGSISTLIDERTGRFRGITDLAVGPDGMIYVTDSYHKRVRRIDKSGAIETIVGGKSTGYFADTPLIEATLVNPAGLAFGPDGSLYIAERGDKETPRRVQRLRSDGTFELFAELIPLPPGSRGGSRIGLYRGVVPPLGIAVTETGVVYCSDANGRIQAIDQDRRVTIVAGGGSNQNISELRSAIDADFSLTNFFGVSGIAVRSDGALFVAVDNSLFRIESSLGQLNNDEFAVPSQSGGELYVFDRTGRHLRTLDTLTGPTIYEFGYTKDRLTSITDRDGNETQITYADREITITAPYGQKTVIELNANGYAAKITNPAEESYALEYHPGGLLSELTDPMNYEYKFTYDVLGRLIKDEDPAGGFKELVRNRTQNGFQVAVTTAEGRTTTYGVEGDPSGKPRTIRTSPSGIKVESGVCPQGCQKTKLPDGTIVEYSTRPDPRFGMQSPQLNSFQIITPSGLKYEATSNESIELADEKDPFSISKRTSTTTINGKAWTTTYDAQTRTVTQTSPEGRTAVRTYDEANRPSKIEVPGILPIEYHYDDEGRLEAISQGERRFMLSYHPSGYLKSLRDSLGQESTFDYDRVGRVKSQQLPGNRVVGYSYDALGNLKSLTPPGRLAHKFDSNAVGQEKLYTPPNVDNGIAPLKSDYNLDRQLIELDQGAAGKLITRYNGEGSLKTIEAPYGKTTLDYDPASGKLQSIASPGNIGLAYEYDGVLLKETKWSGPVSGSVGWTYDAQFRVASQSVNGEHVINYDYDTDGLPKQIGDLQLHYNKNSGQLEGTTLGNVTDHYTYDEYGLPKSYEAKFKDKVLYSVTYDKRDLLGRIKRQTETVNGETHSFEYTYDGAGRLETVTKDEVELSRYHYDANGNRLKHVTPQGETEGTYDDQDRLLSYGENTYKYDAAGRLKQKWSPEGITEYQYDLRGNLRSVKLPDGTEIEYLIDGRNRRVGKLVDGKQVESFLYQDSLNPVAQVDEEGNVVGRFIYGEKRHVPSYMSNSGKMYRVVADQRGSVQLVVDVDSGEISQRLMFDAFGNSLQDSNPGFQPFGFAGGLYDRETGNYKFGRREYDRRSGRWMAPEPLRFADGFNLYAYVHQDPVNLIDPTGLTSSVPLPMDFTTGDGTSDLLTGGVFVGTGAAFGAGADVYISLWLSEEIGLAWLAGLSDLGMMAWGGVILSGVGGVLIGKGLMETPYINQVPLVFMPGVGIYNGEQLGEGQLGGDLADLSLPGGQTLGQLWRCFWDPCASGCK